MVYFTGAIKYLFKYLTKGTDKVMVEKRDGSGEMVQDEITSYINANYYSDTNSLWRLYQFPMTEMKPSVQTLAIHLPGQQTVFIKKGEDPKKAAKRHEETSLTAFFKLNARDPEANNLTYPNVLKHYTFNQNTKKFKRRERNNRMTDNDNDDDAKSDCIGRIPVICFNAHTKELYYLRLLLHHISGPKSFDDLKRLENGEVCNTFHEACIARGLCEDDQEIDKALEEACSFQSGQQFRHFFATLLLYAMPADPNELFEKHAYFLCEDYIRTAIKKGVHKDLMEPTEDMKDKAYIAIKEMLEQEGKKAAEVGLVRNVKEQVEVDHQLKLIEEEKDYDCDVQNSEADKSIALMNPEQLRVTKDILDSVKKQKGGLFFIDAPGGTGKTFIVMAILNKIRGYGKIALAMATTGISSILLPGGRTVHSKLKVPILLDEDSVIAPMINEKSALHALIKQTSILVIDEITMATRRMFNAIDRSLREVLQSEAPFGGLTVLMSGKATILPESLHIYF